MFSLCSKLPCASRHTTLQPVRNPGSIPITRFCLMVRRVAVAAGFPQRRGWLHHRHAPYLCGKLCFDGRFQQTLVRVLYGFGHLFSAGIVAPHELSFQPFHALFVIRADTHFEHPFGFGARMASKRCELQRFRDSEQSK